MLGSGIVQLGVIATHQCIFDESFVRRGNNRGFFPQSEI